jgi:hypothetical protein
MRRHLLPLLILGLALTPTPVFGLAFEEHSSWQKEPWLETEKGVSLGMSVLEMGTGVRFLRSDTYFNSNGNIGDAPAQFDVITWDLFWRFGFTDNWTLWGNLPIVWSDQLEVSRSRTADGELGDSDVGLLYQFYRRNDPTLSMGASLRWRLPTGSEIPGNNNRNITSTGTTAVELAYIGRAQLMRYLAVGWSVGYNIKLPGTVQYILDRHTSITNAWLDLGDEIHAEVDLIGGIEYVSLHLQGRFTYRFASALAIPEYRAETIRWTNPATGEQVEEEYMLHNGASYTDWDVLSPTGQKVSGAGYLFTLTPRLIVRPVDWMDLILFVQLHLLGKNSIYLVNKDGDNSTIDNFMPMQTLGMDAGLVIGEMGFQALVRW